jgi:hypothetical protein
MRILFERAYELLPERIDAATALPVRAVDRRRPIQPPPIQPLP